MSGLAACEVLNGNAGIDVPQRLSMQNRYYGHSELTMILTAYNVEIQNSCNFGNTNNMFPHFYCVALKLCLYSVLSFIVS